MNSSKMFAELRIRHVIALVAATVALCVAVSVPSLSQCEGLHAGITAEFVPIKAGFTEPAHVQLVFVLINDSDNAVDVKAGSWKIVIDEVELQDSDFILGNGPMPMGGYTTLQPGQYYELGKALSTIKYFPEVGKHNVSWKGDGFHSSTITIETPSNLK